MAETSKQQQVPQNITGNFQCDNGLKNKCRKLIS